MLDNDFKNVMKKHLSNFNIEKASRLSKYFSFKKKKIPIKKGRPKIEKLSLIIKRF